MTETCTAAKPRVRPLTRTTWEVTLRSHRATVFRTPTSDKYGHVVFADVVLVHGNDGTEHAIELSACKRSEAELLAYVVSYFEAVEDALVYCDGLLSEGVELSKKTAKALETAMLALVRGYGLVALNGYEEGVFATVVPGLFVRYFGTERGYGRKLAPRAYRVGDACVTGSHNLSYFGNVEKITDKFVWCSRDRGEKGKRHTFGSFRLYNRKTVAEATEHNANERMYL